MPNSIPESPIALGTSFNSVRVFGRNRSLQMPEKTKKEEKILAKKRALEAVEKNQKEQKKAEKAAQKEKKAEEERTKQGLCRIPRKMVIQPLDAKCEKCQEGNGYHEPECAAGNVLSQYLDNPKGPQDLESNLRTTPGEWLAQR